MNEWISVKERLPYHMQKVNFKTHFYKPFSGFFEKTEQGHCFYHKGKTNKIYPSYGVTHWMPK